MGSRNVICCSYHHHSNSNIYNRNNRNSWRKRNITWRSCINLCSWNLLGDISSANYKLYSRRWHNNRSIYKSNNFCNL